MTQFEHQTGGSPLLSTVNWEKEEKKLLYQTSCALALLTYVRLYTTFQMICAFFILLIICYYLCMFYQYPWMDPLFQIISQTGFELTTPPVSDTTLSIRLPHALSIHLWKARVLWRKPGVGKGRGPYRPKPLSTLPLPVNPSLSNCLINLSSTPAQWPLYLSLALSSLRKVFSSSVRQLRGGLGRGLYLWI